jgi:hypothetical protein
VSEAERDYLKWVAEDLRPLLGLEITLDGVSVERARRHVTLRARYRLGDSDGQSEGTGQTIVAAHAALRRAIVEDRIGLSLRALISSVG